MNSRLAAHAGAFNPWRGLFEKRQEPPLIGPGGVRPCTRVAEDILDLLEHTDSIYPVGVSPQIEFFVGVNPSNLEEVERIVCSFLGIKAI